MDWAVAEKGGSAICLSVLMMLVFDAAHFGAMVAAVHLAAGFDAVADDVAIAVMAFRRQRVDRALETVERVTFTLRDDLERFFVVVAAYFAACHGSSPHKRFVATRERILSNKGCASSMPPVPASTGR